MSDIDGKSSFISNMKRHPILLYNLFYFKQENQKKAEGPPSGSPISCPYCMNYNENTYILN